jgi:hypothetical protein
MASSINRQHYFVLQQVRASSLDLREANIDCPKVSELHGDEEEDDEDH